MGFLQNAVIAGLIFLNTFVSGALGFFHLSQPSVAPPGQTRTSTTYAVQTTTAPRQAPSLTTSSTDQYFEWVEPSQFPPSQYKNYILSEITPISGPGLLVGVNKNLAPNYYVKDTTHVYYLLPSFTSTQKPSVIPAANPASFLVLTPDGYFAKDNSHVYENGNIAEGIDSKSFVILPCRDDVEFGDGCEYAEDSESVFYLNAEGLIYFLSADRASFVSLRSAQPCGARCSMDAYDNDSVFLYGSSTPKHL